jgi:hypothetical protein
MAGGHDVDFAYGAAIYRWGVPRAPWFGQNYRILRLIAIAHRPPLTLGSDFIEMCSTAIATREA